MVLEQKQILDKQDLIISNKKSLATGHGVSNKKKPTKLLLNPSIKVCAAAVNDRLGNN